MGQSPDPPDRKPQIFGAESLLSTLHLLIWDFSAAKQREEPHEKLVAAVRVHKWSQHADCRI